IATEDHRFYEHNGIDLEGIGRAAWADLWGSNPTGQGGSTITQQLVRNLSQLGISREKKLTRKFREAMYAMRIEQIYTKPEILQLYLNNIYYGAGAYGVEAAARTYFGKPAKDLNLPQAAFLAGLPQRPSAYSPYDHRSAAMRRQGEVLDRMQLYGYITPEEAAEAKDAALRFVHRHIRRNFQFKAPYFVVYVLNELFRRYGPELVYSGLHIRTTLNWKIQEAAEKALQEGFIRSRGYGANQGALVCIDQHSGFIRAMVGGRDFKASQYNAVTGMPGRQPGSTFKIFDYSAAFDTGTCDLNSRFPDEPFAYPHDPKHRVVHNYEKDEYGGWMSCKSAIQWSKNTIAVRVAQKVGIKTIIDYAHRMGVKSDLAPYLPTALGASAVRPIDLCEAYSLIADKGSLYRPMAIVRVRERDGSTLDDEEHVPTAVTGILKPDTIDQMDQAFEAVVEAGTGTEARGDEQSGIIDGARGKTGTTSDSRDVWFAGYTPELTAVVWMASVHHQHNRPVFYQMHGAVGGLLCAPVWHDFMLAAVPAQRQSGRWHPDQAPAQDTAPAATALRREQGVDTGRPRSADAVRASTQPADHVSPDTSLPPTVATNTTQPASSIVTAPAPPSQAPLPAAPAAQIPRQPASPPVTAASPPPTVVTPPPAQPKEITVYICPDSGKRATRWCPVREPVKMTAGRARRLGYCRIHKPPPGEG
ncbi:MAG TPA: transglycosylase domain-containing protein, partial [Chthonomonadales bacterium]|nr:transglycosylase domain-containing protein [Chthonomonadales bacterium]